MTAALGQLDKVVDLDLGLAIGNEAVAEVTDASVTGKSPSLDALPLASG